MNHDEINLVGSYHRPFWFPFASVYVPVTPCVIDGSLSFLEMVWKLLRDLNKTIEATNQNHTDIMTLVDEINALYDLYENKLSFLEVNIKYDGSSYTLDKTFEEIKGAYDEGIVIGRYTVDNKERFFIAASHYVPPAGTAGSETIYMYALTDTFKLGVFTIREDRISYREDTLITNEGGQITGTLQLPNRDPMRPTEAVPKFYVNNQDAATLQAAKDYADAQDAIELQAAKDYADAQDAITLQAAKDYAVAQDAITLQAAKDYAAAQDAITLQAAKDYAATQDAVTLQTAKDYADAQDAITLQAAKTYADQNFVRTDGDSGNTYASRNTTELNFTDIPAAPSTITISNLLAKLSRWYSEIKNKITRARITNDNGVYKCDKTFAEIYRLFSEGQEVQIVYDDPLLTLETSIMRTEHYGPSSITFSGDGHTCTINSSDVITFS